ncbi:MAG: lysylphosphatidylglycerol synthase domain-containing protein [Candidatus Hydrogenedentota bacterium]
MGFFKGHLRLIAFLLLALVTAYGAYTFFSSDWRDALDYWEGRGPLMLLALVLQAADISFDSFLWALMLREFGIRIDVKTRSLIFMAGYAGLLLPLQLGRFIRSETIGRLGYGPVPSAIKAETVLLGLTAVGNVAVLAAVVASRVHLALAPATAALLIFGFLFFADRAFRLLTGTAIRLPAGFWWRPRVMFVAFASMAGWIVNGSLLFLITHHVPSAPALWQALFLAPANLLLGVATGLPGGVGAIEGFLGVSLRLLEMAEAHLALAVAAFRMITFWFWIPIGWLALTWVNRRAARKRAALMQA